MPTPFDPLRNAECGARNETPRSVFGNFQEAAPQQFDALPKREVLFPLPAISLQQQIDASIARGFLCQFLAKAFAYPEKKAWKWFCCRETRGMLKSATRTLSVGDNSSLTSAVDRLLGHLRLRSFEEFGFSYVAAFGHTVRGDCPLNEIEYGDIKADPLFQPHRLADLGAFYCAFGLEVAEDATERHDHISVELEFMAVLAMKETYALENQIDEADLVLCRDAQKKFLHEHLARWTPAFTRRLARIVGESLLGNFAALAREFIFAECARFNLHPGSEDLMLRPVDDTGERLCESCGIHNLPPGALRIT